MQIPTNIATWEELGRGVYSRSASRRARRGRILYRVFMPPLDTSAISVDRLSIAPLKEIAVIATARSANREGEFQGWAVIAVEAVHTEGHRVVASPISDENPYHADIVLPSQVVNDLERQKRHAQKLADHSYWRDRPIHV